MKESCIEVEEISCYRSLAQDTKHIDRDDWHSLKEWKDSVYECYAQELLSTEMRDKLLEIMALKT